MELVSDSQELNNLYLSFDLYINHLNTACKHYRQSTNDEVLKAIAWFERRTKYLFLHWLNSEHNKMVSCYRARVELDLYKFVDFFETIDIWISQVYLKEDVKWDKQVNVMLSHYTKLECSQLSILHHSANKLIKIARRIVHELYRDQYSIDPYFHADISYLAEDSVLNEEMIYAYCLKGQDSKAISEYINAQEKYKTILDSFQYYQNACIQLIEFVYKNNPDVESHLNHILQYLFIMKVKFLRESKQVIKDTYDANTDFSYQDFFSSLEALEFHIVSASKFSPNLGEELTPEIVLSMSKKWTEYNGCTEETFKYLASYLKQINHLMLQYAFVYMHERYGIVKDSSHLSYAKALEFAGLPPSPDHSLHLTL